MNRVLFDAQECQADGGLCFSGARAEHLIQVLKVEPGDRFRAGLVDGPLGEAVVETVAPGRIEARLSLEARVPARPRVDLILALPRPKVLARMWASLASLGIGHLALTNAWRVERNYFDTHQLEERVYRPLLIEGLQQAGDTRLPTVGVHKRLVPLLEDGLGRFADASRLVAHPEGGARVAEAVAGVGAQRVLLAVGPEGGWIDRELSLFARLGFCQVGLGQRVLRTEVAAVALLALVHDALGLRD